MMVINSNHKELEVVGVVTFEARVEVDMDKIDPNSDNQNEGYQGYHTAVSPGNTQRVDTPVQVFTHTLSPMSASPQQMLHSGFNVSVPTQGALISHPGSVHQMTPMHVSQGGSSHASSPTTPATYVTTSSQWPVTNDGAWYPDTGATHHVTNDSANLQAGTVYIGNRRLLMGNGDGVLIFQVGQGSLYTNGRSLVLQNLLHVPLIKKNLLSVSQLVRDNDVIFEFNANGCVIKSLQSQNVLLRGKLTPEGLYQISSPTHNNGSSSSSLHSDRVSSQQRNFNVLQQPRVTDLGGGGSGCHPVSHMQDQTMQNNDIQEVLQELHSPVVSEPQQQNLESSQQSQQVQVDTSHNTDYIQDTAVDIQNADIDVHRDSVQISPAHSAHSSNDIFSQDVQVTDEIVAEELQDDSVTLDEFQTGNAIEPVDEMETIGEMEPYGDDGFVPSLFGGNKHAMTTRSKNGIRKPKV
ncbi:hypothetical protein GQ457_13G024130 [Hibiscus cannabinus]